MPDEPTDAWTVLINDEEQYGLFPSSLPTPDGWRKAGCTGTADQCKEFVDKEWTDMRPLSLRRAIEGDARSDEYGAPAARLE
jgi:MbtH protein